MPVCAWRCVFASRPRISLLCGDEAPFNGETGHKAGQWREHLTCLIHCRNKHISASSDSQGVWPSIGTELTIHLPYLWVVFIGVSACMLYSGLSGYQTTLHRRPRCPPLTGKRRWLDQTNNSWPLIPKYPKHSNYKLLWLHMIRRRSYALTETQNPHSPLWHLVGGSSNAGLMDLDLHPHIKPAEPRLSRLRSMIVYPALRTKIRIPLFRAHHHIFRPVTALCWSNWLVRKAVLSGWEFLDCLDPRTLRRSPARARIRVCESAQGRETSRTVGPQRRIHFARETGPDPEDTSRFMIHYRQRPLVQPDEQGLDGGGTYAHTILDIGATVYMTWERELDHDHLPPSKQQDEVRSPGNGMEHLQHPSHVKTHGFRSWKLDLNGSSRLLHKTLCNIVSPRPYTCGVRSSDVLPSKSRLSHRPHLFNRHRHHHN